MQTNNRQLKKEVIYMAKGTKITHSTCTSDGIVVKTSSSKPGKGGK